MLQRKTTRRRIVLITICSIIVITTVLWWPAVTRHARLLYWQRRCLSNVVPTGSVVLKIDEMNDVSARSAPEWDAFYAAVSPPGKKTSPTLFVGMLPKSDGSPRIVALDLFESSSPFPNQRTFLLRTTVITPGLLSAPKIVEQTAAFHVNARSFEIYAGQARGSRQPPPRITFDAVLDGRRYTYALFLKDDNEVGVDRYDAATPPAP